MNFEIIDYADRKKVQFLKVISIGVLTANLAALVALAAIPKDPNSRKLPFALGCFAVSLPLLIHSAVSLDRIRSSIKTGGSGPATCQAYFLTVTIAVAMLATTLGYPLLIWYFSPGAAVAYVVATIWGYALSYSVLSNTRRS